MNEAKTPFFRYLNQLGTNIPIPITPTAGANSASQLPREEDLKLLETYENNLIVATWLNDMGFDQGYEDEKNLFYNNETLLNRKSLLDHFNRENRNLFADKNIEFICKKGVLTPENQDNFFCTIDGDLKVYGIFDGHGQNGSFISNYVMGHMLDYIRNSQIFTDKDLEVGGETSDADMTKAIRCCFKYAQDKVREQYFDFLIHERKKKHVAEIIKKRLQNKENTERR